MTCLNCLADIVTNSEEAMEFFSNLPGVTYQYARYSDWISPFLTSQLNLRLIGVEESSFEADKCGRKEIINLNFPIAEWPEGLQVGQYSFPFVMRLPEWLPPSMITYEPDFNIMMQVKYFLVA